MAMTYIEAFVRAYAERAVKSIEVTVDKQTGAVTLGWYGREIAVNLREMVLREDAFARLGGAVNDLLGIPPQAQGVPRET